MLNGSRRDISDLPDLYLELDLILSRAEAVASRIVLPRWNDLNTVCKQTIRVAYLGTLPNAAFLTINLDAHFAATAIRNKRGLALRIGDTLRDELMKRSLPGSVVINLEEAAQRIRNSPFHIHGIVLIPRELWPSMTQRFKERLAASYIEHAGNKAVMLKPVNTPGRLAGYVCKDMLEALPANIRRSYASQDLAAPASGFYSELRNWTQQIPVLRESLRPLLPPRPARSECTSAVEQLVAKKLEQTKRQRAQRRRENAALRRRRNTMGRHRRVSNHELQSAADALLNDAAQRSTQSALQHPRKRNKASDISDSPLLTIALKTHHRGRQHAAGRPLTPPLNLSTNPFEFLHERSDFMKHALLLGQILSSGLIFGSMEFSSVPASLAPPLS